MKPMSLLSLTSLPADPLWPRLDIPAVLARWRQRRRTRQHLEGLDDRLLADIGLNRTQQRIECAKAPWQL
jgi:uncharacterized protein YjiS (DUF1127 family)